MFLDFMGFFFLRIFGSDIIMFFKNGHYREKGFYKEIDFWSRDSVFVFSRRLILGGGGGYCWKRKPSNLMIF